MAESRRSNSLHDAPSGTGTFSKMGFIASPRVMHFCLYDHAGMRVQHRVPGVSPGPESCPPHLPPPAFGVVMVRSEEHTSELQSLMRTTSAVFCLNIKGDVEPKKDATSDEHN